jgi:uncharacterized membrane-anchored protein YitT (DUF2179 family)
VLGDEMKKLKEYFIITFGIFLLAISIEFFLLPNRLAAGGVSGIAIIVNYFIPGLSVGMLVLIMNLILFIIAFIVIGNKFGAKTIYASLGLSGMLWVIEQFVTPEMIPTQDLFLAAVFGTLISGIGMGMIFNQNASTGGTDILAKILSKFVHLNIGKALLVVDFLVTLAAAVAFGAEVGMYALLAVLANGFMIDYVIDGFNICKEITIISSKTEEISKYIIDELERGCTIFNGKGCYSGKPADILYTVLSRREFIRLKTFLRETDRRAFITVNDAHEVLGEGFKNIVDE